jgi:hypothetical protein
METNNLLHLCGSITKKESLMWLKTNILEHTNVAEANMPYAGYYGWMPEKPKPNSLFLLTERYYTLEESLRFTQNIDICAKNLVNAASAVLLFHNQSYSAIRIRNFPDYDHLKMLQQCFQKLGVCFLKKSIFETEAMVTVNKCFLLEQPDEGIYLDKFNRNEGYITIPVYLGQNDFESLINKVKNNGECKLFDAARGGFVRDSRVIEMIRIYSEHLTVYLMKCIQQEVMKQLGL